MNLQPTPQTKQDLVREAFRELLKQPGPLSPATLLTLLGNKLHAAECHFSGILRTSDDLAKLTDEQADVALRLIPTLQPASFDPADLARKLMRKRSDRSSG